MIKTNIMMSDTSIKKLYRVIVDSLIEYINEYRENEKNLVATNQTEIEYFGHILETKDFEVKVTEEGEEHYSY